MRKTARDVDPRELLRTIPMFESLEDGDLAELASALREQRLLPGDVVFRQGDGGSAMYIVAEGEVAIFLPGDGSTRVDLAVLGEGDYFGEIALFDDKPRSASAQAAATTVLLELRRETLEGYVEKKPAAAMSILRTLAERLRETNAMLSERAARNAIEEYEKGMAWQARLADRVSTLNGSWAFILLLTSVTVLWAVFNLPGLVLGEAPDPYPYIFFNLVLAVLVALQWPLIVMSQNRRAAKERKEAEHDFMVNLKNETNCEALLDELRAFRTELAGRETALLLLGKREKGDQDRPRDTGE